MKTLIDYANECHLANAKWWIDLETGERKDRNKGELIALIHSEISEALEGVRKDLMDDKLPHRKMEEVELVDALIRCFDYSGAYNLLKDESTFKRKDLNEYRDYYGKYLMKDEYTNKGNALARIHSFISEFYLFRESNQSGWRMMNVITEIFKYAGAFNLDLEGAYQEKMAYNANRADHKIEVRKLAGGKKF